MKLKFDANQDYQIKAVDSIVNIIEGLPQDQNDFSVEFEGKTTLLSELGIGNNLTLSPEQMLENVRKIQRENDLPESPQINSDEYSFPNFTIEMETGTGKTYVYLRTIFELNKKYGYKKFIIVVPSVAIREGVIKNLQITKEHFGEIYDNTPFNYFVYNSKKPGQVRNYATSNTIQIMVMNIQAFLRDVKDTEDEKNATLFHREADRLSGRAPKEYIASVKPIVILDEPQSIDTTEKGKKAIKSLSPLFTLRYSATHRETYNLMYRLDPVQAFELGLVKQIVVASVLDEPNFNGAYVKLLDLDNRNGLRARIEYHEDTGTARYSVKSGWMKNGDDLFGKSGEREEYRNGFLISEITMDESGDGFIRFNDGKMLKKGESNGGMTDEVKRYQIRETIRIHLEQERKMKEIGLKVLSLFFIDRVAKYRDYDREDLKGEYARWFEEEYESLIKQDEYKGIIPDDISKIHDGYFSQDKKGVLKDTQGTSEDDVSTYDRIMKEKERLLSFEDPLRFIFSHSALREGWDNPNVFQICTLNDTNTEIKKRQEIGRGLRIPVNQQGERVFDSSFNKLTVIANEHYDQFAKSLQEEYIQVGVEFGILKFEKLKRIFGNLSEDEQVEKAKILHGLLQEKGYIDQEFKVTEVFSDEVENNKFSLGDEYDDSVTFKVIDVLERHELKSLIKEKKKPRKIKVNSRVLQDEEFRSLWQKINKKTRYFVGFESSVLVQRASEAISKKLQIKKAHVQIIKADIPVDSQGIVGNEREFVNRIEEVERVYEIPDMISYIQRETELTRKTICDIFLQCGRVEEVRINPQQFLDQVVVIINEELTKLIVDGIKYEMIDGQDYEMRLFEDNEIAEEMRNIMTSEKSPYEVIVTDSKTEKAYAEKLNIDATVKFYVKLPAWFKIDTPIGTYNPDWAILKEDGGLKLYLVRETKGNMSEGNLRSTEKNKIDCAEKHFEALGVDFRDIDPPFTSIN